MRLYKDTLSRNPSLNYFLQAGQDLLYCWNKKLVCCLCYSHHGDFVWAHDRVGVIVSLQICHSVCQQGSKTQLPSSLKIWLTSEKFLPATTVTKICNYKIRTRCRRSLSNGALLALHTHVALESTIYSSWVRICDCICLCSSEQGSTMSCIWIFITRLWC